MNKLLEKILAIKVYKSKLGRYIKDHFPELNKEIMDFTSFLPENATFQERLYCIKNNIQSRPICNICNKNFLEFLTDSNCYRTACSSECSIHDKNRLLKVKQTKKKKYGNEKYVNIELARKTRLTNYGSWHSTDFSKKVKQTKLERYGDENYSNGEKRKATNLRKYGIEYPQQLENVKEKQRLTVLRKYGVPNVGCLESNKEATRLANRKRSYKFLISHLKIATPLFSEEEFLSKKSTDLFLFKCNNCGKEFQSFWDNGFLKPPCKNCYYHPSSSLEEKSIVSFLKEDLKENGVIERDRKEIYPLELDIVVPSKKLAIEFDGLFWHSEEQGKDKNYHLYKTEECEKKDIQLIHIFEDEWIYKKDIVKSRLKNLLGVYDNKCFARQCEVKEVSSKESFYFQEENHIQGAVNSKVNIGLYFKDELVSLMTFSKPRFNRRHEWELVRFCNKLGWHIPGAASKLLTHFEREYKPKNIVSYADRCWSKGNLYKHLGFELDHISSPNYFYVNKKEMIRESRIKYQKHKLPDLLEKFDPNLTESQNMANNGFYKVWDCGNLVFVKNYTNKA